MQDILSLNTLSHGNTYQNSFIINVLTIQLIKMVTLNARQHLELESAACMTEIFYVN